MICGTLWGTVGNSFGLVAFMGLAFASVVLLKD